MNQQFELIEKYIDGNLSAKESKSVEQLLAKDKVFAKEYKLRYEVNEAIMQKDIMTLRENLNNVYNGQHQSPPSVVRQLFIKNWHLVAASVTILIIVGSFLLSNLNNSSSEQIFEKYYSSENAIFMTRSDATVLDDNLNDALEKFQNKEYADAINLLTINETNVVAKYYLGLSYMETDQFVKAKASFQNILDSPDNLFIEQAKWYKGLCLLKLDETEAATELFTSILSDDSLYNEDVTDILRMLK